MVTYKRTTSGKLYFCSQLFPALKTKSRDWFMDRIHNYFPTEFVVKSDLHSHSHPERKCPLQFACIMASF